MSQEKIEALLNELPEDAETLAFIMNNIAEKYKQVILKEQSLDKVNVLDFSNDSMIVLTNNKEFNEYLKYTCITSLGNSEVNIVRYNSDKIDPVIHSTRSTKNKM